MGIDILITTARSDWEYTIWQALFWQVDLLHIVGTLNCLQEVAKVTSGISISPMEKSDTKMLCDLFSVIQHRSGRMKFLPVLHVFPFSVITLFKLKNRNLKQKLLEASEVN